MHLIWRISLLIVLTLFLTLSLYGQYVNEQGDVNNSLILGELRAMTWGSRTQDSAVNQVLFSLRQDSKSHPVLLTDKAKRGKVFLTIRNLSMRVGDFYFLNPDSKKPRKKEYDINTDTISQLVKDLEAEWHLMNDELATLSAKFKIIIEDEEQTDLTRTMAMLSLSEMARTDTSLVRYFFEDISSMKLIRDFEMSYSSDNVIGFTRSSMVCFYPKYFNFLPNLIQYWGDPEWVSENIDKGEEFLEVRIFYHLSEEYSKPWLLFEFMRANAKDPDTVILKAIAEEMEKEKSRYYANPNNRGK